VSKHCYLIVTILEFHPLFPSLVPERLLSFRDAEYRISSELSFHRNRIGLEHVRRVCHALVIAVGNPSDLPTQSFEPLAQDLRVDTERLFHSVEQTGGLRGCLPSLVPLSNSKPIPSCPTPRLHNPRHVFWPSSQLRLYPRTLLDTGTNAWMCVEWTPRPHRTGHFGYDSLVAALEGRREDVDGRELVVCCDLTPVLCCIHLPFGRPPGRPLRFVDPSAAVVPISRRIDLITSVCFCIPSSPPLCFGAVCDGR